MEIIDHNFIIREDCPHMGRDFVLYHDAHPRRKLGKAFSLQNYALVTIVEAGELDLNINGIFTCRIRGKGLLYHLPDQIFTLEHMSDDFAGRLSSCPTISSHTWVWRCKWRPVGTLCNNLSCR
ncbi:MAG: hypothetical protein ACI4BD_05665 [Paludibacteraceae bacterium]